jgi:diaminohydroxyphosphoribosylaminopyrimidine deaminase/5-amino-6-(5-phosphoribosylamino)uracil reductase
MNDTNISKGFIITSDKESFSTEDKLHIRRCFTLAKRGAGNVSPNPLVGAVIVKNGKIISEGWHKKYGGPHAEADAIAKAGSADLNGATLYCNLEPCCHTNKQTPPCTPLIISAGIKRVVISNIDPNPNVAGRGIKQLKDSGIEVVSNVYASEGERLNRFYFNFIRNKRPFITLKIAQSLDGKITSKKGTQTAVTGRAAQRFVHRLRASYDALMIGANTVNIDNPSLTVREVKGRNPLKIVIDGLLESNPQSRLFDEKTIIFVSDKADEKKTALFIEHDVKIISLKGDDNGILSFSDIFASLGKQKITSILVEGGQKIASRLINEKNFDELIILQAAKIFKEGLPAFNIDKDINLSIQSVAKTGEDIKIVLENNPELRI